MKSGNLVWDIAGFPIIGRQDNYNLCDGRTAPSEKAGFLGADLIFLPEIKWQDSRPVNNYDNTIKVPYNALLFHQCDPFGDVFAQRLYIGCKTSKNTEGNGTLPFIADRGVENAARDNPSGMSTVPVIDRLESRNYIFSSFKPLFFY